MRNRKLWWCFFGNVERRLPQDVFLVGGYLIIISKDKIPNSTNIVSRGKKRKKQIPAEIVERVEQRVMIVFVL